MAFCCVSLTNNQGHRLSHDPYLSEFFGILGIPRNSESERNYLRSDPSSGIQELPAKDWSSFTNVRENSNAIGFLGCIAIVAVWNFIQRGIRDDEFSSPWCINTVAVWAAKQRVWACNQINMIFVEFLIAMVLSCSSLIALPC
jgi:hypothetical protein